MHATDLVGINGVTRVLLIYTCQQGVYPRGHIHPFGSLTHTHTQRDENALIYLTVFHLMLYNY
jgi:hypothetical protein